MSATPIERGPTQVILPLRQAVRRLADAGVVHGLDDAALDKLRDECWDGDEQQLEDAGLVGVLSFHYETVERGAKDGVFWRDDHFWQQTDDVVAELAQLVGPIWVQRGASEQLAASAGVYEDVLRLSLERDDAQTRELDVRSLDDVVDVFNEELQARGAPKRLVPLETSGEWRMYVALDPKLARTLAAEGALPVEDPEAIV